MKKFIIHYINSTKDLGELIANPFFFLPPQRLPQTYIHYLAFQNIVSISVLAEKHNPCKCCGIRDSILCDFRCYWRSECLWSLHLGLKAYRLVGLATKELRQNGYQPEHIHQSLPHGITRTSCTGFWHPY